MVENCSLFSPVFQEVTVAVMVEGNVVYDVNIVRPMNSDTAAEGVVDGIVPRKKFAGQITKPFSETASTVDPLILILLWIDHKI